MSTRSNTNSRSRSESESSYGSDRSIESYKSNKTVSYVNSNKLNKCQGNIYNINLVYLGLVFAFLYRSMGVMFPNSDFSKSGLINSLNKAIPDFK